MHLTSGIVVGVEQISVLRVDRRVIRQSCLDDEGLEKPTGVREMPFRRTHLGVPEVSPTKWHLAHTSWFFETFVVQAALSDYAPINPQYAYLFNSYYNAAGKMHCRPKRGLISRPTLSETLEYRHKVDGLMEGIFENEDLLNQFAPI